MRFAGRLLVVLAALFGATRAESQGLRGLVVDSATRQPVQGAVVSLLDSASHVIGRIITTDRGRFTVPAASPVRRARVQRIGFRLTELPIHLTDADFTEIEIGLPALPSMLAPVQVASSSLCSRRDDRAAAYALLEQVRSGLLATIVARAGNTASMRALAYERTPDDDDRRVMRVRMDSAQTALSFAAAEAPMDFVAKGFVRTLRGDSTIFYAPDAEVLLDDSFSTGYCFRIVRADRPRTGQVGLGFDPGRHARGINGVSGVLWVDTVKRSMIDLEFRYLDLGREADVARPGGRVSFREVRPGVVLIDRWSLRLPRMRADTSRDLHNTDVIRRWYEPVETGAELAFARWSDGVEWRGALGTLRATVHHGDSLAKGVAFALYDTDYRGTTDSLGRLEIPELLPGPYILVGTNPQLASVNFSFVPSLRFEAARDSVVTATLEAPTFQSLAATMCDGGDGVPRTVIVGQVVTAQGTPVAGAEIRAKKYADLQYFYGDPTPGRSGNNGNFRICLPPGVKEPISVIVHAASGDAIASFTPADFVIPLRMKVTPPAR